MTARRRRRAAFYGALVIVVGVAAVAVRVARWDSDEASGPVAGPFDRMWQRVDGPVADLDAWHPVGRRLFVTGADRDGEVVLAEWDGAGGLDEVPIESDLDVARVWSVGANGRFVLATVTERLVDRPVVAIGTTEGLMTTLLPVGPDVRDEGSLATCARVTRDGLAVGGQVALPGPTPRFDTAAVTWTSESGDGWRLNRVDTARWGSATGHLFPEASGCRLTAYEGRQPTIDLAVRWTDDLETFHDLGLGDDRRVLGRDGPEVIVVGDGFVRWIDPARPDRPVPVLEVGALQILAAGGAGVVAAGPDGTTLHVSTDRETWSEAALEDLPGLRSRYGQPYWIASDAVAVTDTAIFVRVVEAPPERPEGEAGPPPHVQLLVATRS